MLHEFLSANREELISRCRVKVAQRHVPGAIGRELEYGIPIFLTQLTEVLRQESLGSNISLFVGLIRASTVLAQDFHREQLNGFFQQVTFIAARSCNQRG